jgi:hypothetical protein
VTAPRATISTATDANGPAIVVAITNHDRSPLVLCTATLAPSLALEVTDPAGAPVSPGPPPTPPSDLAAHTAELQPGESLTVRYSVAEIFPGGAPPGRYSLRLSADVPALDGAWSGRLTSDWVTLALE